MSEPMDKAEESALWRHWRTAVVDAASEAAPAPDPLLLAGYAEHRLSEAAAEEVEAWLALHPDAITDVLAVRESDASPLPAQAPEVVLTRAMELVPEPDPKVVPLRRPAMPAPAWRLATTQFAMVASLVVVSLIGFTLGTDAYTSLLSGDQSAALGQDLFDPPSGVFSSFGEETSS